MTGLVVLVTGRSGMSTVLVKVQVMSSPGAGVMLVVAVIRLLGKPADGVAPGPVNALVHVRRVSYAVKAVGPEALASVSVNAVFKNCRAGAVRALPVNHPDPGVSKVKARRTISANNHLFIFL